MAECRVSSVLTRLPWDNITQLISHCESQVGLGRRLQGREVTILLQGVFNDQERGLYTTFEVGLRSTGAPFPVALTIFHQSCGYRFKVKY